MGGTEGGAFKRMLRKLTSDVGTLDADDLSEHAEKSGAQRASDCRFGQDVTVFGRLRSVEFCPQNADATLEAELFDGTEGVTLVWMGRRRIPGIEPGRTLRVRGRLAVRDGRKVIYNPYYDPEGYTSTSIAVDYAHLGWIQNAAFPEGRPIFEVPNGTDYVLDNKGPNINGKRWFSHALTQALLDNGVFSINIWPADVATPQQTAAFWPYRITIHNYPSIGEKLPELRVMLTFAAYDHVQAAPDKPHIRQAYDGFHTPAGLWTRLNCDLTYVQAEVHPSATLAGGFPDNDANTEPVEWFAEAEAWGFEGRLVGEMTTRSIPHACVAEMADRVQADDWSPNLDAVVGDPTR